MNRIKCLLLLSLVLGLLSFAGCGQQASTPSMDVSKFVLTSEPAGAVDVVTARESKDGDPVTVFGRIGGSESPWVEGYAAFNVVDASLKSCTELGCDCPKPWDYC